MIETVFRTPRKEIPRLAGFIGKFYKTCKKKNTNLSNFSKKLKRKHFLTHSMRSAHQTEAAQSSAGKENCRALFRGCMWRELQESASTLNLAAYWRYYTARQIFFPRNARMAQSMWYYKAQKWLCKNMIHLDWWIKSF